MKWSAAIALLFAVGGCGGEPFYDTAPSVHRFLVLTTAPALQLRQEPGGVVLDDDVYRTANGSPLTELPRGLTAFRETLYLLLSSAAIEPLEAATYRRQGRILLPAPAEGIAFPNATTGYVWHGAAGMVSIVDLLSGSLAGTLPVSGSIHDAVVAGAMLYAVDTENSRLLAIDTRTRALVGSLALPPRPRFLTLRSTGDELLVLSWGSADDTTTTSPRAPRLSFIRLTPLELLGSIPVYSSATDSARTHVTGIVATAEDFAYVATSAGLVRVDVRSRGSARVLQRWNIRQLLYVPYRGEFWIVTTDTPPRLIVAAGSRAEELFSAPLPEGTIAILPLP